MQPVTSGHWGLQATHAAFFAAPEGSYRWVRDDNRRGPHAPPGSAAAARQQGSIRDAVTRYNEERGGYAGQEPRQRNSGARQPEFPDLYRN